MLITSSALSDWGADWRGERRMSEQRQMKHLYDTERNRCWLCCRGVCAARSLYRICIMRSASLLCCIPLIGVPVVASSRSLFTKAFLFSSSSWLGIRPALPPSIWQAYEGETHMQREVANELKHLMWLKYAHVAVLTCHQLRSSWLKICRMSPLLKLSPASLHGIRLSWDGS